MVEPIITTGAVIVGSAAWFANKLFGPSVDALGEAIRSYGTNRVNKILGKAADKTDPSAIKALPPGFAVNFFQKASFSDDDDELTEMWANLLSRAATSFTSRHTAYVEILSQLTPYDADQLRKLVGEDVHFGPGISKPVNMGIEVRRLIASGLKNVSENKEEANEELDRLLNMDLTWPGRITSARLAYYTDETRKEQGVISGGISDHFASYDNLRRLGLLETFELSNSVTPYFIALEGVLVSMLGVGFVQTCRGTAE